MFTDVQQYEFKEYCQLLESLSFPSTCFLLHFFLLSAILAVCMRSGHQIMMCIVKEKYISYLDKFSYGLLPNL